MKFRLLSYHKMVLSSCVLVYTLFLGDSCRSINNGKEEIILSPCVFPSYSSSETGVHCTSNFFDNKSNQIDAETRRESILMWLKRGGDKRQPISNTKEFPYSTQVYFTATFPHTAIGSCEIGSGTFIDKDVILTAAHVVYSHEKGGYCTTLKCIPAAQGRVAPFGISSENRTIMVSPKYIEKNQGYKQYDYALAFTKSPLGGKTGYMGLADLKNEILQKINVTIEGYPGDKIEDISSPSMWWASGKLTTIRPEELYHDIDTYKGQSGSGIWYKKENEYYLVGVHAYGTEEKEGQYNYGPRLTRKKGEEELGDGLKALPSDLPSRMNRGDGLDWYDFRLKYKNGDGAVEQNNFKARVCFQQAFEKFQKPTNQKNPEVQHKLAVMYYLGLYVNRDPVKAVYWWKKAAHQDHIKVQFNLGLMYEKWEGVKKQNIKKASKWYEKATLQGDKLAQYNLAEIYKQGKGIDKNETEQWNGMKKSAIQGVERVRKALERLGKERSIKAQEDL
ncbi:MAG: SEL1-like repeat protein [Candidatus Paracaedibacteraceae bacterium]|nr:SEL1-like repeat protein [Candidatus Paracaedibacteraceae bacterium]